MKQKLLRLIMWIVMAVLLNSCSDISLEEISKDENETIARTIDACIGWFKNKDFELLFSVVAHDSNYLSVHPTDRVIRGFAQFEQNAEVFKLPEFKYVRHEVKDLKITRSGSGDVAWFYCMLNDINTWKGQPANWENARWTGVLEKRDKRWVIVQQHFSFAAD